MQIMHPKGRASIMEQIHDVESTDPLIQIWELSCLRAQAIAARTIPDPQQNVENEPPEKDVDLEGDFVEVW